MLGIFHADIDHRAPFREPRAAILIFLQPIGELVEPGGDDSPGHSGKGLGTLSTLMPGIAPDCSISSTSGVPSLAFCQMVSS